MNRLNGNVRIVTVASSYIFAFLLLFGCGLLLESPTPAVHEVTRIVVATPTYTPQVIERVITVTVVVEATLSPDGIVPSPNLIDTVSSPTASSLPSDDSTPSANIVPSPTKLIPVIPEATLTVGPDNDGITLMDLAVVAQDLQTKGIHTIRLTVDLAVPIEVAVKEGEQSNSELTILVQDQLSDYNIRGNYIVDISVDDLAKQRWVIKMLSGTGGLADEYFLEVWQDNEQLWERPGGNEWIFRSLATAEPIPPLGNTLVPIDAYGHSLNLSNLIIDSLHPILLSTDVGRPTGSWTEDASQPSVLEIQRESANSSSYNLGAIVAAIANSGLNEFAEPTVVTDGMEQIVRLERAWLAKDTMLVDHGEVYIRGHGTFPFTYLLQQSLLEANVTLFTTNSFQYLTSTTVVVPPD